MLGKPKKAGLLFTALFILLSLVVFNGTASAFTDSGFTFKNRALISNGSVQFTEADRTNDVIEDDLSGVSIAALNSYVDVQIGEFLDSNIMDSTRNWVANEGSGCESVIKNNNGEYYELVDLRINIPGRGCTNIINKDLALSSLGKISVGSEAFSTYFRWVNENTMVRVDGKEGQFVAYDDTQPKRYFRVEEDGESDQDYVEIGNNFIKGNYNRDGDITGVTIGEEDKRTEPPTDSSVVNQGTATPTCETEGGKLSFILCPSLELADGIIAELDESINNSLRVNNKYFQNDPSVPNEPADQMEASWTRLRNIAYSILVPVVLVMVISTALGFDFISAYTVKKALPRLIFAVMFIALSWEITSFLVVLTNDVGNGMAGLISAPFGGANNITLSSIMHPDAADSATGSVFLLAAAGAGAAVGSIGILLSYAFVTVVALFIGFTLLAFRQMLIIALMLLAPLAILAWIFPGNDKLWKLWWGSFNKLLLLYPLIAVLIAAGKSFASVVDVLDSNLLATFIKLVAYVGPYFFIPAAFKFAGGVFGNIAGMANDRGKGLFDRNKKYRGEKAAQNFADWKKGDKSFRPKWFNDAGMGAGVGWKGRYGMGKHGRAATDLARRAAAAERMKDPLMNQLQFDDDGIMALALSGGSKSGARQALRDYRNRLVTEGHTDEAAKWTDDRIEKAVATADTVGYNRSSAAAAMDMMARNKSFSLYGGEVGMNTMLAAARRLSGGNRQMEDNLMGSFEFNSRQAGRMDLGMHDYKTGTASMVGAWSKATLGNHAQGTGSSLQAFADFHLDRLQNGNKVERRQAAIAMMEMQNMLPNATGANQEIINRAMFRMRDDAGRRYGLEFDSGLSIEDQIALVATSGPTGTHAVDMSGHLLTGATIRGQARVYDSNTPLDARDPSSTPTTSTTTTGGGTP